MNPLHRDPTRTTTLRNAYAVALRREYEVLARDIALWVETGGWMYEEDDDLDANALSDWSFSPRGGVLAAFTRWLNKRLGTGELNKTSDGFIEAAYDRGTERGIQMVKPAQADLIIKMGFLQGTFRAGTTLERLKILKTQAKGFITGLTQKLITKATNILADGMIRGESPNRVAKTLATELPQLTRPEATRIARTEIIRAHAEGALDAMEAMGVEEIGVEVEWSTSGDGKVCPKCAPLQSVVIPIKNAHGMFPRHPNCRCSPIPAFEQVNKARLREAIAKSLNASRSKNSKKSAATEAPGAWPGSAIKRYLAQ